MNLAFFVLWIRCSVRFLALDTLSSTKEKRIETRLCDFARYSRTSDTDLQSFEKVRVHVHEGTHRF